MRALTWGLHGLNALAVLGLLFLCQQLLRGHEAAWAMAVLGLAGLLVLLQFSKRMQAWRYVMPGVLAVAVFIVLPMGFTLAIGFTNYSSAHLLSFTRATEVLLQQTESEGQGMDLTLWKLSGDKRYEAVLVDDNGQGWHSEPFSLKDTTQGVKLLPAEQGAEGQTAAAPVSPSGERLDSRAVVALLPQLRDLVLRTPDDRAWRLSSLHRITDQKPRYAAKDTDHLVDLRDGSTLTADHDAGVWRAADGHAIEPGFRTTVGWANYTRIFGDRQFLEPFGRVFAWTVSFATLNTLLTFALGLFFAVAISWPALKGRSAYRIALFLPYAVPAFISIPVFRGLFNENLGEINLVLDMLFGVRPGWFSDATLARAMVLTVNTWLGYPYMMILAMGLLKAIPEDLYEASALAGAGPLTNLFRITLPLIMRPMAPLLVASFAANFNNLTLIALLTEGAPDYLDTVVPVGATDLLASYTYRIAFNDGGQNYALACAISSIVFVIVALLAYVNLRFFGGAKTVRR
ncbi:maltose/maltodextrin transport system permease protein [Roseateles sp. YR242]|uniref:maltose ABC transporter permease MalF n=1 Tax=Roseateles sp. YR242 TaxID=1855305 RepID=UPI0008B233C6|nr:maltose ABC transporter permease MalF [Roseateles sp. YR242]SEL35643.1 maltose/maltodextrin transport system permease protein [Roseateles sp. YR242]